MENFNIFNQGGNYGIVVVMKTSEPPFDYLSELSTHLKLIKFQGSVVIDQLLHCGNTNERFIVGYFDGEQFQKNSFSFETVDRRSPIRKYICDFLRDDQEVIDLTILNQSQKRLISKGCYI